MSKATTKGTPARLDAYARQSGRPYGVLTPAQQRRANKKAWRAMRVTIGSEHSA